MSGSQFGFLRAEFADEFAMAEWAERHALSDPGPAVIYARKCVESGVKWAFEHDRQLPIPYEQKLNAYLNEPAFKGIANGQLFKVSTKVQRAGNRAVHESKPITQLEAVEVVSALFMFCKWLAWSYGRESKPDPDLKFDPSQLVDLGQLNRTSLAERQELEARLEQEADQAEAARLELAAATHTIEELEAERAELIAAVAEAKRQAEAVPVEEQDWSEAETRAYKIDHLLREAGWRLDQDRDREYRVAGMPTPSGVGSVDYVLWGDDGKPLGLVEAKRTTKSAQAGQQQAKLYADCLEAEFGRRPVLFYTNGYDHWMWDDTDYPPRPVQGFYNADELERLIQRRSSKQALATLDVDASIAGRHYQTRAIRSIAESFEEKERKALLVMATGSGKTRTVIALTDLLLRANWAKRILFLADRKALVKQAVNNFKAQLPDAAAVNLVEEPNALGQVYVSTYPTMVGKIDELEADGTRRFGPGFFDLVVIDEAHRSVYKKYRGIFEYFDSLLVGLTATPKDEITKNTYDLFDLETGVPTDAYTLDEAIADGYLVPPRSVSVPLKFVREGIRYDELSEDEKDEWDDLDWGEDEDGGTAAPPDSVSADELNKWLFNADTVDKALAHLMENGIKVAGGDRLGKTIIFAKNQQHAEFIYERFIANYPALDAGRFAQVITNQSNYAQSLIDDFSNPTKTPHIAISVDMLDTGIDVPEVVNLMFFKLVRSKTKFWQMLGRGTRLSPDLFGSGRDKREFFIFDFCGNLEYFSETPETSDGSEQPSLNERIFVTRLELLGEFDTHGVLSTERSDVAGALHETVAAMNTDNFLVRPHARLVDKFSESTAWDTVTLGERAELASSVASLPTELPGEHEDAKRFDVLVMISQLALLRGDLFEKERRRIVAIADQLEQQRSIPAIDAQLELLQDVQTEDWWQDVTYPMLEEARLKLRALVPLIEKRKRAIVTTDFEDEMGEGAVIVLPGTVAGQSDDFEQFRRKARSFLRDHLAENAIAKIRNNVPITPDDEAELQRILVAAGIGSDDDFVTASREAGSIGQFVRSLVGLDRAAAIEVFNDFLDDKRYSRNQIQFVTMIIDYLTEHGTVPPGRIYESPFTAVAPEGPDNLFVGADVEKLFDELRGIDASAAGS